jgi:hypothetical protein
MKQIDRNLTRKEADLAHELALYAIQHINKGRFTVYATLDIEKPETINNFNKLGEVLLMAYKRGAEESK